MKLSEYVPPVTPARDVEAWLDERVDAVPGGEVRGQAAYDDFAAWAAARGDEPMTVTAFGRALRQMIVKRRDASGTCYMGIALRA